MNPNLLKVKVIAFGTEITVLMHPNEEMQWLLERALTLNGRHRDDDRDWRRRFGRGFEVTDQQGHVIPLTARYSELAYETELFRPPFYVNEPVGVDG